MIFMCFSIHDRQDIVEPLVYQLTNYGFDVWYDRAKTTIGDDRDQKNFIEGVSGNPYAVVVMTGNYSRSNTMKRELAMLRDLHERGEAIVFPVLYEIRPSEVPEEASWLKDLVYAECTHATGTRGVCNSIACRITEDMLAGDAVAALERYVEKGISSGSPFKALLADLLSRYEEIDGSNYNSRVTLLYAIHRIADTLLEQQSASCRIATMTFTRLFNETKLCLEIDLREIWLLENVLRIELNLLRESLG